MIAVDTSALISVALDEPEASARRVAAVYSRWGRGTRTAGLNFGDCFAYEVAAANACPLLFVGGNFAKTDVIGAI